MSNLGPTVVKVDVLGSILETLQSGQQLNIATGILPLDFEARYNFAQGTGANQADDIWSDERTLAASANEVLELNGGSLVDAFGFAIAFTAIKALVIMANANNTNDVVVGAAGSNPLASIMGTTGTVNVKPGGCVAFIAPNATGYVVTPSTAMNLKIANSSSGTGVTYTIIVVGV